MIPAKVHLPCYIVIIAGFVTIVQMVMHAYMGEPVHRTGRLPCPLIVAHPQDIILGRAEMFACKNSVVDSALTASVWASLVLRPLPRWPPSARSGQRHRPGFTVLPESMAKMSIMTQAPAHSSATVS